MRNVFDTREGWLVAGTKLLNERFFGESRPLPKKLQCSCGFPRGQARVIGQCWDPQVSADGTTHVFICPSLDGPTDVLATLLHELIHAAVGVEHQHKKPFRDVARAVGLAGKPTATYAAPGSELHDTLLKIADALGPYPHARIDKNARKKGKARGIWLRLMSPNEPSYKIAISPKQFAEHGAPMDPWGDLMELPGEKENDDE